MTTIERLIKNLCETKRGEILTEKQQALAADDKETSIPRRAAPPVVRLALRTIGRYRQRVKDAEKVVAAAGFKVPALCSCDDDEDTTRVEFNYDRQRKRTDVLTRQFNNRVEAVAKLRQTTHVACLGKPPAEQNQLVRELAAVLEKV